MTWTVRLQKVNRLLTKKCRYCFTNFSASSKWLLFPEVIGRNLKNNFFQIFRLTKVCEIYLYFQHAEQSSFKYNGDWKKIYSEDFTTDESKKIKTAFKKALEEAGFKVKKIWGEIIEDRGSQITYSALGQQAPLDEKKKWDPDFTKRKKIKSILDPLIPGFSVRMGGETSIDVTKPGIDKAYGIGKLRDILGISIKEMIFIGDALFPGGNDYPAEEAGVVSIPVKGPNETKRVTETIIACLDSD